jgi:hypothetical protein
LRSEVNNIDLGLCVVGRVDELVKEKNHRQSAQFKIATQDTHYFPLVRPDQVGTTA